MFFAFDKVVQLRNGVPVPVASGELGAEVPSRNGEAAFVVPGEPVEGTLSKNDGPWFCALAGAIPTKNIGHEVVAFSGVPLQMSDGLGIFAFAVVSLPMNDGPGLAAFVEASLQMNDGPGLGAFAVAYLQRNDVHGLAATDGASLWRSEEPGFGATFLQRNDGPGPSGPGGFDRYPQNTDCVGLGELLAGVGADVEMGLSGIDAGGGDSGEPVAAVLGASYREDG